MVKPGRQAGWAGVGSEPSGIGIPKIRHPCSGGDCGFRGCSRGIGVGRVSA